MREPPRNGQYRDRQCAQLAARMLIEGSAHGFENARRKAARRLNITTSRDLPDNKGIFCSLIEYQQLYDRENTAKRTIEMRRAALIAMNFLAVFSPQLTGAVMHGTPCKYSPISLHLFTDEAEAVARYLLEQRRLYRLTEAAFRVNPRTVEKYPCFELSQAEFDYKLVVMPYRRLNRPPPSPIDGKPSLRLDYAQLEALVATNPGILYGCGEGLNGELIASLR